MRISELSRRSGVSNATIKYYLREGLLPPGRATAATQAEYDESHLRRLRLIRALTGVRGLSVASAKQVLDASSAHQTDTHRLLGIVFGIWPSEAGRPETQADGPPEPSPEAAALVEAMGWSVSEYNPARQVIDQTLRTLRSLGIDYDWQTLLPYAELAARTARHDLDRLDTVTDPLEKAEQAVLLTFLLEPALMALRRLAQEDESIVRYGDGPDAPPSGEARPPGHE
ncbi:MerR family transcriptional regulator [Streptomyces griseoincarnatus]|uniref:MerR family transcriptional regulator n=1 Tax=Streptomyces griseoincarnatus TaxID=29305 RepID=A0ABT0VSG1_STRGI|nr:MULTISPECIES: MerR family transcriptional regulator [Streptomyces]MBJ6613370.1 MerR family transcriptional regulator [Streptomyces sp. I3(2020)]MBJ6629645.1 MerR family transcriptional regulator [Streptomyces sp. I4(2020)]MCM2513920.1 MerR family transcriptional regulator [Streptomyces griseoincarnatus]